MAFDFKKMVADDRRLVFLNLAEFGEEHKVDGKTIPVFGVDATDSAKQLINEGKMTGTIKQDAEGMASTILNLVSSVQGGGELMDNTSSFNVDEGVAKIRVPYATYTGE